MEAKLSKLKNNIQTLVIPRKDSMSAIIMVLVKVGSRYENKMQSGIAHFVEHMFFKGTEKRPTSKHIGMDIEKIGGSSNAFTSYDYTGYYIKVPKENLDNAVEIIADMMKNGVFDQAEIDKERGVIIEEIRMYEDRPMSKVQSLWTEKFFGDTPLGRDIAGSIETVSSFNRQNFLDFIDKYYAGENIVISVAGGFDQKHIEDLLDKNFSDLKENRNDDYEKFEKEEKESQIYNLKKQIEQSHIVIGGYSHAREYEHKYTLKVANTILSQGFGSRLFQVIRDQLGLAYYVYSRINNFDEIGTFQVGLGVENSKVVKAVEAVMKEIKEIIDGNFDDEELVRAKNFILGRLVTDMEESDEYALWFGLQQLLKGKYETVEDVKSKIANVSKKDVVDQMKLVISGQNLVLASVTPHDEIDNKVAGLLKL